MEYVEQTRLLSDPRYQDLLDEAVRHISANNRYGLPRYGSYSLIARRMPMFVYDHPIFVRNTTNTAFTDGAHIFINKDFLIELIQDDARMKAMGTPTQSILPLIFHEIDHNKYRHIGSKAGKQNTPRLSQFTADIANIAGDIKINMNISKGAPWPLGPEFTGGKTNPKTGVVSRPAWGMSKLESDLWDGVSEERIARHLMRELARRTAANAGQQNQPGTGQQSQPGAGQQSQPGTGQQSQPGAGQQSQPGAGQQSQLGASQQSQPGAGQQSQPAVSGEFQTLEELIDAVACSIEAKSAPGHLVNLANVVDALKAAGLDAVIERLGLPSDPSTKEGKTKINNISKSAAASVQESLRETARLRDQHHKGSSMWGGHSDSYADELISGKFDDHKLSLISAIKRITDMGGMRFNDSDDVQDPIYFMDPIELGMDDVPYVGSSIPARNDKGVLLALYDSSASMSKSGLELSFSETLGFVSDEDADEGVSSVYVASADTALRSTPVLLTAENIYEHVDRFSVYGRGGTEFVRPIREAMSWALENNITLDGIIYFSDLDAAAPPRSALPEDMPPIVFVGVESLRTDVFKNSVSSYAEVVELTSDIQTIDLEQLEVKHSQSTQEVFRAKTR